MVLVVLLVAVGVLGVFVALKGLQGGGDSGSSGQPVALPPVAAAGPERVTATNQAEPTMTNIVATSPAEDREARVEQDLEALREALAAGPEDPGSLTAVAARLVSPEAEVRKEAVTTAIHLGNTNVLPYLAIALQTVEDPHEKAAIMDAIELLKLLTEQGVPADAIRTNAAMPSVTPSPAIQPRTKPAGGK